MPWCLPLFFLGGTLQGIRSNSAPGPVSHLVSPAQPRSTAFPSLFLSAVGLHPPPPPCRAPRFSLFHAHAPFSQPSSSLLPHPSRAAGSHSQSSPHSFCASIERRFRLDVFPFILLLDLLGKARLVPFFFQPLFTLCALHVSLVRQQRRPPQEKHSLKHRQQRVLNTDSRPFSLGRVIASLPYTNSPSLSSLSRGSYTPSFTAPFCPSRGRVCVSQDAHTHHHHSLQHSILLGPEETLIRYSVPHSHRPFFTTLVRPPTAPSVSQAT